MRVSVLVNGFDHECCGGEIAANDIVTWTLYFTPTHDPAYLKVNHAQIEPGVDVTGRIVEFGEPLDEDFVVVLDVVASETLPDVPATAVVDW